MKTIRLHDNWKREGKGYVLPSPHLRDLVIRRMLQKHPEYNYVITWKDKYGYGVTLSPCEWVTREYAPGHVYIN